MSKLSLFTIFGLFLIAGQAQAGAINVSLSTAGSFAVLAGSTVTNTGFTNINGNLGVWPGTSITGFPPGSVVDGSIHDSDAVAQQAQSDLTTAYNFAASETVTRNLTGTNLGGLTLSSGVYNFSSFADLTGVLTLNGQNNPDAVFVFQIGSTLTTATASTIKLLNGASGAHIFWEVGSSATLGTNSIFDGSVLALTSITLNTGADIDCGRALARNGAVTLDTNAVSVNTTVCSAGVAVPEPSPALLVIPAGFCLVVFATTRRRQVAI